jgi:hypothetical protein
MMDIIQVLNLIIKAMVTIEKMVTLSGESKKNSVITYLKENLPEYEKYAYIIPVAIELVVLLSRQKRVAINLKKYSCIS